MDEFQKNILRSLAEESRKLGGKPVSVLNIVRNVGENKKKVNATLYKLKDVGIVQMLDEIPPKWFLAKTLQVPAQMRENVNRMQQMLDRSWVCSNKPKLESYIAMTSKQFPKNNSDLLKRILAHLESEAKPLKSITLAQALGFAHKREINPFLYELQRQGLLLRSSDNPPMWMLNEEMRTSEVVKIDKLSIDSSVIDNDGITSKSPTLQELHLDGISEVQELSSISIQDFTYLTRNPISTFLEHAQAKHIDGEIQITSITGPPHDPTFEAVAVLGSQSFPSATGKSKKQAKILAAESALKILAAKGFINAQSFNPRSMDMNEGSKIVTIFDEIAALSHRQFYNLTLNLPETYTAGRKIIATIVMKDGKSAGVVVSVGTGNRVILGGQLSQAGEVLNDCHAEVIARRAFRMYLFQQLVSCYNNQGSIFQFSQANHFQIRQDVTFHLYISTSPCGDGAIFSQNDVIEVVPRDHVNEHMPLYSSKTHGQLRTKIESGEGSVLIEKDIEELTWDGVLRGSQRLRTMSCSDKIAKWNVVGLQGALLSHFIKPVYLNSVTIGYLFCKDHLARALCCRLSKEDNINNYLPENYHLNHPKLGSIRASNPLREAQKTKPYSLNWTLGEHQIELVDSTSGQCIANEARVSRLCKFCMFKKFREICKIMKNDKLLELKSYAAAKDAAVDYCKARSAVEKQFLVQHMGPWVHKPIEEKSFLCNL